MSPTDNTFPGHLKSVDANGSFEAIISSTGTDRDNEAFAPGAFHPLPQSVPIHWNHGGPLVGSGNPEYRGELLYLKGRFASTSTAQEARTLAREGHLSTMSIVFLPSEHKWKGNTKVFTRAELVAADLVTVPSNRESRLVSARSYSGATATSKAMALAHARARLTLARAALALEDDDLERRAAKLLSDSEQLVRRWRGGQHAFAQFR